MRYRIAQHAGRYIVLPVSVVATLSVASVDETYATRAVAQAEADWMNTASLSTTNQATPAAV